MTAGVLNDLIAINNRINDALTYTSDDSRDHWQTLSESLKRKRGDCEDYACAKFHLLTKKGYEPYLMYCYYRGQAHMVCVCDGFVLDNINTNVLPLRLRSDLSAPVYTAYMDRCECRGQAMPVERAAKWAHWLKRSGLYEDEQKQ